MTDDLAALALAGLDAAERTAYVHLIAHGAIDLNETQELNGLSGATLHRALEALRRRGLVSNHAANRAHRDKKLLEYAEDHLLCASRPPGRGHA